MNVVDAKNQSTHELRVQSLKSLSHTRLPLFCFLFFFCFIYIYTCIYTFCPPKVALNYSSRIHARVHAFIRAYIYPYVRTYHVFSALFLILQLDTVWLLHFGNSAALAKFSSSLSRATTGATCCTQIRRWKPCSQLMKIRQE